MYISPFWAGVAAAILAELAVVIAVAIIGSFKNR